MTDFGWLDANIFVHVLFRQDPQRARCMEIIGALRDRVGTGWLDPVVLHELTYVVGRLPQFPDRAAVFEYLNSILALDAVHADDKDTLSETLSVWAATDGLGFADARLTVLARRRGMSVCSANGRDFRGVANSFDPKAD